MSSLMSRPHKPSNIHFKHFYTFTFHNLDIICISHSDVAHITIREIQILLFIIVVVWWDRTWSSWLSSCCCCSRLKVKLWSWEHNCPHSLPPFTLPGHHSNTCLTSHHQQSIPLPALNTMHSIVAPLLPKESESLRGGATQYWIHLLLRTATPFPATATLNFKRIRSDQIPSSLPIHTCQLSMMASRK